MKYPKYQLRCSNQLLETLHSAGAHKVRSILEQALLTPQPMAVSGTAPITPQNGTTTPQPTLVLQEPIVLQEQEPFVVQKSAKEDFVLQEEPGTTNLVLQEPTEPVQNNEPSWKMKLLDSKARIAAEEARKNQEKTEREARRKSLMP